MLVDIRGLFHGSRGGDVGSTGLLFDLPAPDKPRAKVSRLRHPIWSEHKAKFIERYLFYFVLVTHHGVYIDGFAGPQREDENETQPDMWTAKLVLESEPRWLRRVFLCDLDPAQVARLRALVDAQPPRRKARKEPKRRTEIVPGDFNETVDTLLAGGLLPKNEATFCLLDQRTFECKWTTVEKLARHKTSGNKIELFYFLPNWWLNRSLHATTSADGIQRIQDWWGRDDWRSLADLRPHARAELLCERFRRDLGYADVKAYPIYQREDGGPIMYFMIHATDYPDAPKLMARAYNKAGRPKETVEQLELAGILERPA